MSDDIREREPRRDLSGPPSEDGVRSDHAGTSAGSAGPAPAGGEGGADEQSRPGAADRAPTDPGEDPARSGTLGGQFGSAGGGYGTGSAGGSGTGTPDGTDARGGPGPQTDWLRGASGDGAGDEAGSRQVPSDALGE